MKKDDLVREIRYELDQLKQMAEKAGALAQVPDQDRRPWDAAAAAKYATDLFLGLENLCKRRYRWLGSEMPDGPESHTRILQDFLNATELGGRLSPDLALRLKKYLRFRHRFFHGYGHEVSWDIVEEPLRLIPETVGIITDLWIQWLSDLPAE